MEITQKTITEYLETLEPNQRAIVETLHQIILDQMPDIKPKMWEGVFWGGSSQSIIGYGEISYTRSDKKVVNWFMVGLTVQKNYISAYVTGTEDGKYLVQNYAKKLGKVKTGSSSISFQKLEDLNLPEFKDIIQKTYKQLQQK